MIPFGGSVTKIRITVGVAPMYGPNTGITFVTPTTKEHRIGYGIRMMSILK